MGSCLQEITTELRVIMQPIDLVMCVSPPCICYVSIHHGIDWLHHIDHLILVNSSTIVQVIPTKCLSLSYSSYRILHFKGPGQLLFSGPWSDQVICHDEFFKVQISITICVKSPEHMKIKHTFKFDFQKPKYMITEVNCCHPRRKELSKLSKNKRFMPLGLTNGNYFLKMPPLG